MRTGKIGLVALAVLAVLVARPAGAQTLAQITSPRDRAEVRGLVPIEGSATHPQFQKYEVHYGPEPNPADQWTPVGGSPFSVPVVQGRLVLWDTTVIPDGLYSLRLRVVRLDGNYDEYFVRGIVVANTRPVADTPTPMVVVTAEPTRPPQTPTPTPTIMIAVPTVASPTPQPSDTPLPTRTPTATAEPMDLPFQSAGDAACWGVGATVAAFTGVGLLFAFKGAVAGLFRWLARRGREGLGLHEE